MDEVVWRQPFRWGLLMAFDAERHWVRPDDVGTEDVSATPTCLTVPVRYAFDVEIPEGRPIDDPLPRAEVQVVVRVTHRVPDDVEFVGEHQLRVGEAVRR